jgi:hypothetical protein
MKQNRLALLSEAPLALTFLIRHDILRMFRKEQTWERKRPGHKASESCIGTSERRTYETNEETSTAFRDGISD